MQNLNKQIIALDCETFLIGKGQICPKVVCVTFATYNPENPTEILLDIRTDAQGDTPGLIKSLLVDPNVIVVGQNIKYDLGCIKNTWPDLVPDIWKALAEGRITDTIIREKLLNLTSHGKLEAREMPDGSQEKLRYSLEFLAKKYLGINLHKVKTDPGAWRLRYGELSGKTPEEYPPEALNYALGDAEYTLRVYYAQQEQEKNPEGGPWSCFTEYFRTACDFAFGMFTENGFPIDQEKVSEIEAMLDNELSPEKLPLLIESGLVRPAKPSRPRKNTKKHPDPDGRVIMTKAKPESVNKQVLKDLILDTCSASDIPVIHTAPTKKYPDGQISTEGDFIDRLAPYNPVLQQYAQRQAVMKLKTSYLPALQEGIVYSDYDILKETGRVSSFGGKLYPSWNGQQVDPRVRPCCIADPGWVLVSSDFHAIELVSLAQKIYDLFGKSTLRDLILEGVDPHAYLGAQLAYVLDQEVGFRDAVGEGVTGKYIYGCFAECKTMDDKSLKEFFAKYRKLAKPTGLGYPGGLGATTFVKFAKGSYGVDVDEETATMLRDIWHETFPEMRNYFRWVNEQHDPNNDGYLCYESPLGMYRAGATYCAVANGAALQTPTAEGALGATFDLARACCDPAEKSILFGCKPLLMIHDEFIVMIPEDDLMHERAMEIKRLMEQAMGAILIDMPIRAEPVLMRRWDKKAEPMYDAKGRLQIWEP
jgi:hypothetical protein